MKYLIYLAACWPFIAVITAVVMCRIVHKSKARIGVFLA